MFLDRNKPHNLLKMPNTIVASRIIKSHITETGNIKNQRKFSRGFGSQSTLLIACFLGMGLLTASCGSSPKESADAQSQGPRSGRQRGGATAVDVAIARTGVLQKQPEYTGTTIPFRTVSLRSQVEGRLYQSIQVLPSRSEQCHCDRKLKGDCWE